MLTCGKVPEFGSSVSCKQSKFHRKVHSKMKNVVLLSCALSAKFDYTVKLKCHFNYTHVCMTPYSVESCSAGLSSYSIHLYPHRYFSCSKQYQHSVIQVLYLADHRNRDECVWQGVIRHAVNGGRF